MIDVEFCGGDFPVDDYLMHYGVKGMKWGVRKERQTSSLRSRYSEARAGRGAKFSVKTKHGETVDVVEKKTPPIAAAVLALRKKPVTDRSFSLSVNGEEVGEASVSHVSKDEVNLVWLSVNQGKQGKGYGSAAFSVAIEAAKKDGASKLTLEVPGISPDARHIYEKQGFRDAGPVEGSTKDDIWGGLTKMEYDIKRVRHSDDDLDALLEAYSRSIEKIVSEHSDAHLAHYGVKGMKWGVRRKPSPVKTSAVDRKRKVSKLSDNELNRSINRLEKEKKYRELLDQNRELKKQAVKTSAAVATAILTAAGTATVTHYTKKYILHGDVPVEDYLMHYGVKGMRWGVRKQKNRVQITPRSEIRKMTPSQQKKAKARNHDIRLQRAARAEAKAAKMLLAAGAITVVALRTNPRAVASVMRAGSKAPAYAAKTAGTAAGTAVRYGRNAGSAAKAAGRSARVAAEAAGYIRPKIYRP